MRFLLGFGFLALIIQCESLPVEIPSNLSRPDESALANALSRVKKDTDVVEYLEECAFVDSWQEQPGYINVLAFLDASWEYSHRQATMLKMLQGRLERAGIKGIKFFVINSAEPEATVNNLDIEDEKEAWGAAEHTDDHTFSEIEQTREALKNKIDPDITFIQDNDKLRIWEKLSASRDQVVVIDKCGRLSYRVIVPWSILHFPYVKASILSTHKEQPCGECNLETTTVSQERESQTEPITDLLPENLTIKQMEEIAVKTYNLDQSDNTVKKLYHDASSHDIPENVIQLLNGSAGVKHTEGADAEFDNNTKHGPLLSTGDYNSNSSYQNSYAHAPNITEDNRNDNEHGNPLVSEDTLNMTESGRSENDSDASSTNIDGGTDSVESGTFSSIEKDGEKSDFVDNNHGTNNRESTESTNSNNTLLDYEEKKNSDIDLDSVEADEPENGNVYSNTSDAEAWNSSTSSSMEEADNRINKTVLASDESNSNEDTGNTDYVMPIRIIMHAPHIHKHEEQTSKYEYLVLKLGSPEYHGHLDYNNAVVSSHNEAENEDEGIAGGENEEAELGSGEVGGDEDKKIHQHHGNHHHGNQGGRKHSRSKHLGIVYGKDESPGFYGEDAEYWRNFGNADDQERLPIEAPEAQKFEHGKDKEKQAGGGYDYLNITENDRNSSKTIEESESDTITEEILARYQNSQINVEHDKQSEETVDEGRQFNVDQKVDENNSTEEEIANHLIVHYSKLIPWLDYVI